MAPYSQNNRDDSHGRTADRPSHIPKRGWKDIVLRVKDDLTRNNVSLMAAGEAFYVFLAIPSVITALVSLYGLISDPADVQKQVQSMQGVMPAEAAKLISDQLTTLTSHSAQTLGLGFIISLLVALWSAQSGTSSIMRALDIAYGEEENRGLFRFYGTAFVLTLATVLFGLAALALIGILPAIIDFLPLGNFGKTLASLARWPILLIMITGVLAMVYRYAPAREEAKWRWVSWGALVATVLWIVGSALFSIYVSHFAHYDKSYGSLGAVVVLMMWLYLSSYAVLLGGQLNAEIEHQTARDSTTGSEQPLGRRGARMADSLGDER
jgi:membrane protein